MQVQLDIQNRQAEGMSELQKPELEHQMKQAELFGIAATFTPGKSEKPVRDPEYRRFVKKLPCAACCKTFGIDPCHTGPHGMSQKASDLSCIPLCRKHHQEHDAAPREFAERHNLNVPALIEKLNTFYAGKIRRAA